MLFAYCKIDIMDKNIINIMRDENKKKKILCK